jgi:hypothetical protein
VKEISPTASLERFAFGVSWQGQRGSRRLHSSFLNSSEVISALAANSGSPTLTRIIPSGEISTLRIGSPVDFTDFTALAISLGLKRHGP